MNIKRIVALGLATLWLFGAQSVNEHAYAAGIIVSNIWLATLLLLPQEAKK